MSDTRWRTRRFQLIGLLPLTIFLYRLGQYVDEGTPDWIMANCNVTLLMLSLGMLAWRREPIRVAAIWLTIGVPMWLIDAWVTQVLWIASILSHLGGWLLGLYALRHVRVTGRSWLPAAGWFFFWQIVTRLTTKPELNVNIAHTPYEFVKGWFAGYWQFWPVCALVVVLLTWLVERGLVRGYPVPAAGSSKRQLAAIDDQGMAGDIA
jgi:hypothetical protein